MKTLNGIAAIHARCALWLCGQCHSGPECTCLPSLNQPVADHSHSETMTVTATESNDGHALTNIEQQGMTSPS